MSNSDFHRAELICKEALQILSHLRKPNHAIAARFYDSKHLVIPPHVKPGCYAIVFPLPPSWRESSLEELSIDYLQEAALRLALQIPDEAAPTSFSRDLECPQGVIAAAVNSFDGWQLRAVIDHIPIEQAPEGGTAELMDYYNINHDLLERRVCSLICRLDVRPI